MPRLACTLVVRNTGGEPLPGTRFVVEHASEPMPEIGYVTGADGVAHAGLPPGEALLRFFLRGGGSQVVVVSAYEPFDRVEELARLNPQIAACIRKPVSVDALGKSLQELARSFSVG